MKEGSSPTGGKKREMSDVVLLWSEKNEDENLIQLFLYRLHVLLSQRYIDKRKVDIQINK